MTVHRVATTCPKPNQDRSLPSASEDWRYSFASELLPPLPTDSAAADWDFQQRSDAANFDSAEAPADLGPAPPGYRLIGRLGSGAMGEVLLARDLRLQRLVALKMIRADEVGPMWREQFLREAQAVASLQHASIVQIFEVGESTGRPFLALEYVAGGSLASRLAMHTMPPAESARLVGQAALAIHSAHERGIVHRDLKPANVLLGGHGPKVADFGLAMFVEQADTTGIVGTPSYMAPEQAAADRSHRVGPPADVYALGGILYECLSGRPPFRGASKAETLSMVLTQRPTPLPASTPRDLAAICYKCLEKSTSDRYATARELAEDLDRFLRGEPVAARPVSIGERLWKWSRRRPVSAALSAMLAVTVSGAIVGGLIYQALLRESLTQSEIHRKRAEANHEKTLAAVDRFLTRMGDQRLAKVPEMETVRADLLRDALQFYEGMIADAEKPEPSVRFETAQARTRVARILSYLGRFQESAEHYRSAIQHLQTLAADHPQRSEIRNRLAEAHLDFGTLLAHRSDPTEAGHHFDVARRLWQELSAASPLDLTFRAQLAKCDHQFGWWHTHLGRLPEADEAYRHALRQRRELLAKSPQSADLQRDLAKTLHNVANVRSLTGNQEDAVTHETEAVSIFESLAAAQGYDEESSAALSAAYHNLGVLHSTAGEHDRAHSHHAKALQLREALSRRFPRVPDYQGAVAASEMSLACVELNRRRPADAIPHARRAVEVFQSLSHEQREDLHAAANLLSAQTNLALAYQSVKQVGEAKVVYGAAFETAERLRTAEPSNLHHIAAMAALCLNRGNIDLHGGNPREALAWFDRAIASADRALSINSRYADAKLWKLSAHGSRAQTYECLREYSAAVADWDRVVELSAANNLQLHRLLRLTALARAGDYARTHSEAAALSQVVTDSPSLQHIAEACAAAVTHCRTNSPQVPTEHRETVAALIARGADCLRRAFGAVHGSEKLAVTWNLLKNPEMRNLLMPPTQGSSQAIPAPVGSVPPK